MRKKLLSFALIAIILAGGVGVFLYSQSGEAEMLPTGETEFSVLFSESDITIGYNGASAPMDSLTENPPDGVQAQQFPSAVKISFGDISILIVEEGAVPPDTAATVLVLRGSVPDETLLQKIAPGFAVLLSSDAPEEDLLRLLDENCTGVYRGDLQGEIRLTSDGQKVSFTAEKHVSSEDIFPYRRASTLQAVSLDYAYVVNLRSKAIHLPYCSGAGKIKDENRLNSGATLEELIAQGYHPCGSCRPDLSG